MGFILLKAMFKELLKLRFMGGNAAALLLALLPTDVVKRSNSNSDKKL